MFRTASPLLLAALLAAAPAWAQSTDETAPATDTDTAAPEAPADAGQGTGETAPATDPAAEGATETPATGPETLDMGTPVPGAETAETAPAETAPRVGQPYIRAEFGDWALRCLKAEEGQLDPCQLYQLLMDDEGNAVAEFSTFPLPEGGQAAAGATIVVPLETLLTQNLRLTIDNGQPKTYPFTFCNQAGCVSRVGFTAAEVTQLKRGARATLRMVPAAAPDEEVVLNVSLTGFTAGFDSVDEQ